MKAAAHPDDASPNGRMVAPVMGGIGMAQHFTSEGPRARGAVKPVVIVLVTVGVIIGAVVVKGMFGAISAFAAEERGRDAIGSVARALSADGALTENISADPVLHGKLGVADWDTGGVESFYVSKIPEDMRATSAEDLGTLLLLDRQKVKVGTYVDEASGEVTGEAYRWVWDASLVDVASRTVVAKRQFVGKDPPEQTQLDWNWGADPVDETMAWAVGMMR